MILGLLCKILEVLYKQCKNEITIEGGVMKFTVARDHADEPIEVTPVKLFDKEGEIPSENVIVELVSTNPDAVSVIDNPDKPGDPLSKLLHFGTTNPDGTSAVAQVLRTVKKTDGSEWLAPASIEFIIPFGAVDHVEGGDLVVPGLTPDPE